MINERCEYTKNIDWFEACKTDLIIFLILQEATASAPAP